MADSSSQENEAQTAFVSYLDQETGNVLDQDRLTGQAGAAIDYQPQTKLDELAHKGYQLAYSGFPKDAHYDEGQNQVFAVILGHEKVTIDPKQAGEVGSPINADDPNGSKWPALDNYQRTFKRTISFVDGQGNQLLQPVEQTSQWSRQLSLDKVTGQAEPTGQDWQSDDQEYPSADVPVIGGYVANESQVPSQGVESQDITTQVTYQPVGRVQPVGSDGQTPLDGVNAVSYQNDPNDPTKVLADQPVPEVKDFAPSQKAVQPASPTADTKVVYKSTLQTAVIKFVDADSGNILNQITQHGKVGTMILYNPLDELEKLNQQGYQMAQNGFALGTTYQAGPSQEFEIQVRKPGSQATQATQVTQATNQAENTAANSTTYSLTVHFVDQNGKQLHNDHVQEIQWTSNANGQLTPSQRNYDEVKVPVINGYCTERAVVPTQPAGQFNSSSTVIYRPMGHFVPVDEQGQAIAGAAHPVYRNDPNDPTKLAGRQAIPQINGYQLAQNQASPKDPSQDTSIVYHKVIA